MSISIIPIALTTFAMRQFEPITKELQEKADTLDERYRIIQSFFSGTNTAARFDGQSWDLIKFSQFNTLAIGINPIQTRDELQKRGVTLFADNSKEFYKKFGVLSTSPPSRWIQVVFMIGIIAQAYICLKSSFHPIARLIGLTSIAGAYFPFSIRWSLAHAEHMKTLHSLRRFVDTHPLISQLGEESIQSGPQFSIHPKKGFLFTPEELQLHALNLFVDCLRKN